MWTDPLAAIRVRDTGISTSYQAVEEHAEHANTEGVFLEKRRKSAVAHLEHREHRVEEVATESSTPVMLWDDSGYARPAEPPLTVSTIRHEDYELVPPRWRGGLQRLNEALCPAWLDPEWWAIYVTDAFRFAMSFGNEAVAAGWTISSLFGVNTDPGLIGLVADLRGERVVALWRDDRGRDVASILTASGGYRWHYRQMSDGSPLLWEVDPRTISQGV